MKTMQRQGLRDRVCTDAPADAIRDEIVSRCQFIGSLGGLMAAMALERGVVRQVWAQTPAGALASMFAYLGCYNSILKFFCLDRFRKS